MGKMADPRRDATLYYSSLPPSITAKRRIFDLRTRPTLAAQWLVHFQRSLTEYQLGLGDKWIKTKFDLREKWKTIRGLKTKLGVAKPPLYR